MPPGRQDAERRLAQIADDIQRETARAEDAEEAIARLTEERSALVEAAADEAMEQEEAREALAVVTNEVNDREAALTRLTEQAASDEAQRKGTAPPCRGSRVAGRTCRAPPEGGGGKPRVRCRCRRSGGRTGDGRGTAHGGRGSAGSGAPFPRGGRGSARRPAVRLRSSARRAQTESAAVPARPPRSTLWPTCSPPIARPMVWMPARPCWIR